MEKVEMRPGLSYAEVHPLIRLHLTRVVYLFMAALSFYFLFISRTGEVSRVWDVLHPAFMPLFLVSTLLLLGIIFSSENLKYKLLFIIIHSLLSHSLMIIVYPAGEFGTPQMLLGRTRLIFENILQHGYWSPKFDILFSIYLWMRGDNFQAAFTVIFARMYGVDVYWSHLLLVPVLWGTFVPLTAYMFTKALGVDEDVSVLSGLMVSLIPNAILWGALTVTNSLGFLFFFCSLQFFPRYVSSGDRRSFLLLVTFSFLSFISHLLTGFMSLPLLLLAVALREYENIKGKMLVKRITLLLSSFILSVSLMPVALVALKFIYPQPVYFGLSELWKLPTGDIIWLFAMGEYANLDVKTVIVYGIGLLLGIIGMTYYLKRVQGTSDRGKLLCGLFLAMGFLVIVSDYRIAKFFMTTVPFGVERLWVFRDFLVVPFMAIAVYAILSSPLRTIRKRLPSNPHFPNSIMHITNLRRKLGAILLCSSILILLSGFVVASVYYAYPTRGGLKTTDFELEAVSYIDTTTKGRYIVVCDQSFIYAAYMFVGENNPRAYYYMPKDPELRELYTAMMKNPSPDPLIQATQRNNATVAYFVVVRHYMDSKQFDSVVLQALYSLELYGIFGQNQLYIFAYRTTE